MIVVCYLISLCIYFVLCMCLSDMYVFFFFKQKTAYEMRISDWSSDVCSSDLAPELGAVEACTNELIEKGRLDGRMTRMKKADGTEFWGAVSSRLATLGGRTISIGTVVDLTDRMAKEAELREARETLTDAVESLRSEEHTSELQSLMRNSYAVFCLKKKKYIRPHYD